MQFKYMQFCCIKGELNMFILYIKNVRLTSHVKLEHFI